MKGSTRALALALAVWSGRLRHPFEAVLPVPDRTDGRADGCACAAAQQRRTMDPDDDADGRDRRGRVRLDVHSWTVPSDGS